MESIARTDQTCIIVVEAHQHSSQTNVGIIVDHVSEVLEIPEDCIEDPPSFGASVDDAFIIGLGKLGQNVKILLDIDRIIAGHICGI
jgi:purine-binding chemotaxis protein CheW